MDALVQKLISEGTLKTPRIIEAFKTIDRHDFVPPEYKEEAYGDYPLPIGAGQTISQPTTVAFMLELLAPERGDRVLDVGSGSGWTTALLAYIVGDGGNVAGVEILDELVSLGQNNLAHYPFKHASIRKAPEGKLGLPSQAPFNRILVSAAANMVPRELLEQRAEGGVMVIPIKNDIWKITRTGATNDSEKYGGFAFVPLLT